MGSASVSNGVAFKSCSTNDTESTNKGALQPPFVLTSKRSNANTIYNRTKGVTVFNSRGVNIPCSFTVSTQGSGILLLEVQWQVYQLLQALVGDGEDYMQK